MSYKEEVKTKIGAIKDGEEAYEARVSEIVREVYARALEEAKITGESVESVTYEILEGIQEALLDRHEEILRKVSEKMIEIIHDQANDCITVKHQKARQAQQALEETIEREKAHLNESLEAFRAFAREKSLSRFAHHLQQMEAHVKGLIHGLTQRITFLGDAAHKNTEKENVVEH